MPEAEDVVGRWRRTYTTDGRDDMPAHVTLLYPFVERRSLDRERVREVEEVVSTFPSFAFVLAATSYFEGDERVLYLAPDPAAPFAKLTEALVARFPDFRPYGGRYDDVVPHVTVAQGDAAVLEAIEEEVRTAVPIHAHAREAWLMEYVDARWRKRSGFAFAA